MRENVSKNTFSTAANRKYFKPLFADFGQLINFTKFTVLAI